MQAIAYRCTLMHGLTNSGGGGGGGGGWGVYLPDSALRLWRL